MRRYRFPRPGDLLAVRTSDPGDPEHHVVIERVADTGDVMYLAGTWRNRDLEVVLRRVGDIHPLPESE